MPATLFYTRRFITGINTKFSCVLHTHKLKHATLCRIHACSIHNDTYCIYICYLAAHIRHVTHVCCTHNTSIMHACCIHKNRLSATCMPYKQMKKCMQFVCNCLHAACMLYINNCMYAARNICAHVAYMYSDVCDLMCMSVALSQFLCMQHTCNMDVLCVQHACSVYAQYVQQGSRYMCSTQATFL